MHGKRLAAGDVAVANCVDCHGVHDIREVRDALSPVHPLRLPETCARCHADAGHMAKYKIETNQFDEYRTERALEALAKRGDLSAPSCASCHGNHGATPPQVSSVAAVCGTCHVLFEDLYNKSPHQPVFAAMGGAGCIVCHGKHEIREALREAMLSGDGSVCAQCHEADSAGGQAAAEMANRLKELEAALARSEEILGTGTAVGNGSLGSADPLSDGRENADQGPARGPRLSDRRRREAASRTGWSLPARPSGRRGGLKERTTRRFGLSISLVTILITMAGLWLAIRSIENHARTASGDRRELIHVFRFVLARRRAGHLSFRRRT